MFIRQKLRFINIPKFCEMNPNPVWLPSKKDAFDLGIVAHTHNPNSWETEARGSGRFLGRVMGSVLTWAAKCTVYEKKAEEERKDRRTKEGRERKREREKGEGLEGRGGPRVLSPFHHVASPSSCLWGLTSTEPPTAYLECWIIGLAVRVVTKFIIKCSSLLALEEQWPHASVYLWVPRGIPPSEGGCLTDSAIMVLLPSACRYFAERDATVAQQVLSDSLHPKCR